MAFMNLKIIVFEKTLLVKFALFLFLLYLLPILTNETPLYHILAFAKGSIEHILGGKTWL